MSSVTNGASPLIGWLEMVERNADSFSTESLFQLNRLQASFTYIQFSLSRELAQRVTEVHNLLIEMIRQQEPNPALLFKIRAVIPAIKTSASS
jgi:hypothetical protein